MSLPAIRVAGLTKEFEVYDKPSDLALEVLTRKTRHKLFRALDDVSFDVAKGEVLGIIGSNGAGKSTLLKIITGVLDPTAGSVEIRGKVTAILELGLGFNMEYTGRENIRLSGLLYGMTQAEIERKLDSIIDFSGLDAFIDMPIKTYSSGMFARLAFSIATAADPEILIIDEALAAGDAMFVQKCLRRIREFCNGGRTVLLVSHGTGLLAQLCERVAWLDKGVLKACGPALQVIQQYDLAAHAGADSASWLEEVPIDAAAALEVPEAAQSIESAAAEGAAPETDAAAAPAPALDTSGPLPPRPSGETKTVLRRGPYFIDGIELLDSKGKTVTTITTTLPFALRIRYRCDGPIPEGTLGVAIAVNRQHDLAPVTQWFTQNIMPCETREAYSANTARVRAANKGTIVLQFPYVPYGPGEYLLSAGLLANQPANWEFYEYRHFWYQFKVDDAGLGVGAPLYFRPVLHHIPDGSAQLALDTWPNEAPKKPPIDPAKVSTLREEITSICIDQGGYPEKWPHHKHCPCCSSGPSRPSFSKFGFEHKECLNCGFVYVDPYPPDEVAAALYRGQYYTKVRELFELPRIKRGEESTPFSAPRETLLDIIQRHTATKAGGNWLDVGGGLGAFAALVKQWAPTWDVTLNEFNTRSLEIASEVYGLKTSTNSASQLAAQGAAFDVISSVMVLEHIADPFSFVKEYSEILKPGGSLVTIVPNMTRLSASVSHGSSASVAPPFHLSLFNAKNLRLMLTRTGLFENIEIGGTGPAAFALIHHIPFGDKWDISIPSQEKPDPQGILVEPYDYETAVRLNTLAEADQKMGTYFSDIDGQIFLTAHARRKA